jgi:hypothetical protein
MGIVLPCSQSKCDVRVIVCRFKDGHSAFGCHWSGLRKFKSNSTLTVMSAVVVSSYQFIVLICSVALLQ